MATRMFTAVGGGVMLSSGVDSEVEIVFSGGDGDGQGAQAPRPPRVILIFPWYGATPPQVRTITSRYHSLFPTADQVLIWAVPSLWWGCLYGLSALEDAVRPAMKLLHDRGITSLHDPSSRVYIHVMSNGGCLQLATLLNLLVANDPHKTQIAPVGQPTRPALSPRATHSSSSLVLPIEDAPATRGGTAILFDSAPGALSIDMVSRVLSAGGKSTLLRALALPPATLVISLLHLLSLRIYIASLGAAQGPYEQMWNGLKDAKLIPATAPRLYVYSTPDTLVRPLDVERHIQQVRESGVEWVAVRKNEKASHVSTARLYPEQYWADVRALWEGGLKRDVGINYGSVDVKARL